MGSFCENLKTARKAKGLTIVQCAAALGRTNASWSLWETGKRQPKLDEVVDVCRLLDVTPNDLLGIDKPASQIIGSNNAVAIGAHATATGPTVLAAADCRKCPYRIFAVKLQKAGMAIPGL